MKKAISFALAMVLLLMPTLAAPQTISPWAKNLMIDGEKYGIFPRTWYETPMTEVVTADQAKTVLTGISGKLAQIAGTVKKGENPVTEGVMIRELLLTELYEQVATLDFKGETAVEADLKVLNPVEFMQKYSVILGDGTSLMLDKPCTLEQLVTFGTRLVKNLYSSLDAGSEGFYWKAEKNGNTVYMLGSIHMANQSVYPYRTEIETGFAKADALYVEVDMLNMEAVQQAIVQYMTYTDGTNLADHISPELYQKILTIATQLGLEEADAKTLKAWYWQLNLDALALQKGEVQEGHDAQDMANFGVDMHFMNRAASLGKPIVELESAAYQYKMLDDFSDELQEILLQSSVDNHLNPTPSDRGDSGLQVILDYFITGDVKGFAAMANSDSTGEITAQEITLMKEYNDALLTNRNKNMADKIAALLEKDNKETAFVMVGALHYVGIDNVIDMLKAKGYQVELVK